MERFIQRDRSLANALRREKLQAERTLRSLGIQYQQKLAGVCGAQLQLRRALDKLNASRCEIKWYGESQCNVHSSATAGVLRPMAVPTAPKPCCPNRILCSTCNLRLRLADAKMRRFTPSLWTMYCQPGQAMPGHAYTYTMPRFMEYRSLTATDNSIRYLPFI